MSCDLWERIAMSKYEHKADLSKIEVCKNLTGFLRSIQFALASGYRYYVTGQISYDKIVSVMNKFDEMYRICESAMDRTRRHKLDQAVVTIKVFFPVNGSKENDVFHYILLAKPGINKSKRSMDHIFFYREKYSDAHNKKQAITIEHYVFTRINKEAYEAILPSGKQIKSATQEGVWTCTLSEKYIKNMRDGFNATLLNRDWFAAHRIMCSQTKLIPFHGVRHDYLSLRKYFYKTYNEFIKTSNDPVIRSKKPKEIYQMLEKLMVMKGITIFKIKLSELLNNKILKKTTIRKSRQQQDNNQ